MVRESKKYALNRLDGWKVLRGAGIALGGALLVYVSELVPLVEWGAYGPLAVAVSGILINVGRKLLAGKK